MVLRRLLTSVAVVALPLAMLPALSSPAQAAPPTTPWTARASGSVAEVGVQAVGLSLADVGLASSVSTASSTAVDRATSVSSNIEATVVGLPILRQTRSQVAPPDPGAAAVGSLAAVGALGIGVQALTTRNEANWVGDSSCVAGAPVSDSTTTTAGVAVAPLGIDLLSTGVSSTRAVTALSPVGGTPYRSAVTATSTGTLAGVGVLGGAVQVGVVGSAVLTSRASGTPGGAAVGYVAPVVTVTSTQGTVALLPGQSTTVDLGLVGAVTVSAGQFSRTESADGRSATGSVDVVSLSVRAGPAIAPLARADVSLLPLRTASTAPAGGIDCPPPAPVIDVPAQAAVVADSTPTVTGTGVPGAAVTLRLDGAQVATGVAVGTDGTWSWTPAAGLAQGSHTLVATQSLVAGVVSPPSAVRTFSVDSLAPTAPVVQQPADGSTTGDSTPTVTGTAEAGSTVTVVVDGTAVGTAPAGPGGAWSFDVPVLLADGTHTVAATSTDTAGNTSPSSAVNTFTVDTAAPATPVVVSPANGSSTADTTPAVTGTSDPSVTVTVLVDGASAGTTTSDPSGAWTFTVPTVLADGTHTVAATSSDAAGNVSPTSASNTFTVDTALPGAPTVLEPPDGSATVDSTPTVTGSAEAGSTVTVVVDGAPAGTTTADTSGGWALVVPAALADGTHTVRATATDAAGNVSPSSATNTFTVDTTASGAPVVISPADGSVTNDSTPDLAGTADPASVVTVTLDGAVVGTVTAGAGGTWTLPVPAPLADGLHAVRATATDGVGNVSPSSNTNAFTVDTTLPVAPVVVTPANGSSTSDTTPDLTGTAEAGTSVAVVVDGTTVGTVTADALGGWTLVPPPLAAGSHTVRAVSTDAAGNVSPSSATNTFVVDIAAPAVPVVTDPAPGSTTADRTPDVVGTAEANSTVTVVLDGVVLGTVVADGSGAWTLAVPTPLVDGLHSVSATATDAAGNTSPASVPTTFTVDATAPAAPVVLAPEDGSVTDDSTPVVSGTAEPGSTVSVSVDGAPVGTAPVDGDGDWSLPLTAPLADGPHQVTATATDPLGNASPPSAPVTVVVDTTAPVVPVVLSPLEGSVTPDSTPLVVGTAEPGSTVTVRVDGAVVGTTTADGLGDWTLAPTTPLADGPHTVAATATDAVGNVSGPSADVGFVVDATAPPAPVVVAPAAAEVTDDQTPTISGTAEPASTVTVELDGAVLGTTTADASGDWSITPATALVDGPHTVSATATDVAGNGSPASPVTTFTVDSGAPLPPTVTTPADGSVTSDPTPTYSGGAEAGSTVTVLVDGAAVGTAPAGPGTWTLTPALPLLDGPHTVVATATDGAGNTSAPSAVTTFLVDTVVAVPAPPVVVQPADGELTSDSTPTVTGTSEPGSTVEVVLDGVVLGTATTTLLGAWTLPVATPLADGSHTVSATASEAGGPASAPSPVNTFVVDATVPPAPVVTAPSDGSVTADTTPVVSGSAEPGSSVSVILDGSVVAVVTADGTGAWTSTVPAALADGPHTVAAVATDPAGNVSVPSAVNDFVVDTTAPPAPVVSAPADGSTTNDTTPTVVGTAEPLSTVTVLVDGSPVGTATTGAGGGWTLDLTVPLAEGPHTVAAVATDEAGNPSVPSAVNEFVVDTAAAVPAAPVVLAPADGSTGSDSTPVISGTGVPGAVVTVLVDGAVVGTTTADGDGAWSLTPDTELADGPHSVLATQVVAAGPTSPPSAANGFVVDTGTPAAPVIVSPADGTVTDSRWPVIEGTGEPGATVTVVLNGVVLGTALVDEEGAWTLALRSALRVDGHVLGVFQTDDSGNASPWDWSRFWVLSAGAEQPPGDGTGGGSGPLPDRGGADRPDRSDRPDRPGGSGGSDLARTGSDPAAALLASALLLLGGVVLLRFRRSDAQPRSRGRSWPIG